MRPVFNSLMAALVVVALFWGNCFSCPQILLAAQKHSCCPHGKADPNDCKTQGPPLRANLPTSIRSRSSRARNWRSNLPWPAMIGGIFTSFLLELVVYPAIYEV